jgi:ABC-type branched-subunit amino acid transport system ATPase component
LPVLEVEGVTVRFGGVIALTDVDLTVAEGTLHGLIGPNGAGKTTLIDAVTGFARCSAGTMRFEGTVIDGWSPHRRARAGLSRTFQNLELYVELSVRENLAVASQAARRRPGPSLEDTVDLLGLGAELDRPVRALPHGRQRVVSIARALAGKPALLVLDEPAAGLDTDETTELGQTLRAIVDASVTVLLVDHDMSLVMGICDWIDVLDFGCNLASGLPTTIAADPDVQRVYLGDAAC